MVEYANDLLMMVGSVVARPAIHCYSCFSLLTSAHDTYMELIQPIGREKNEKERNERVDIV
jgi:DNA-directed RNA polymerase subunit N (RpoN/RPB10)